jgi:predicted transposase/invertase (TIGR01784 family)
MAERFAAKAITEVKLETARAALKKGFSIDDVAEITGLPNETVLELKKELEN